MKAIAEKTKGRSRRRFLWAGGVLILVAVAGFALWRKIEQPARVAAQSPAVPVTVASATLRDVPILLQGLGTVAASNTVAIHSQIDGKLQSVNFVEGQEVHKGDTLAVIDPRALQAALDQAVAKKAQDQAQLIARAEGSRSLQDAGRSRTSRPSRTSTSSRPRSISSRPRSTPTRPRSRARRRSSPTPPSRRRSTAASASARSTSATSSMPTIRIRSRC